MVNEFLNYSLLAAARGWTPYKRCAFGHARVGGVGFKRPRRHADGL